MTAIDIAVQTKRLGAEHVDMVYRRGPEEMGASRYEQEFAQTSGVKIRHWAKPVKLLTSERVAGVEFERTILDKDGKVTGTGERYSLNADVVFKAIGQSLSGEALGSITGTLDLQHGKIVTNDDRKTSLPGVWAGGDCVFGSDDLTVSAVQVIAVQTKHLGAEHVDIVYRRGPEEMGASRYEQEYAQTCGVKIRHWAKPVKLLTSERVAGVEFERTTLDNDGNVTGTGERYSLNADVVFKAIGQSLSGEALGSITGTLELQHGKIITDDDRKTSLPAVWAGGDCVYGSDDLTVSAVQDGKIAAIAIDRYLREESNNG